MNSLATTPYFPPSSWHGYSQGDCQWLLAQPYQDLANEQVALQLVNDFVAGKAQVRMRLIGVNAETDAPEIIYACKYKPERDTLFMIRIDPDNGKPWDIKEEPAGVAQWKNPILGNLEASDLMGKAFERFAHWHRQSFGAGPVAPQPDPTDPNAGVLMDEWAQGRRDRVARRTQPSHGPDRALPRL